MDINNMTRREFEALPLRAWNLDIGIFDSLIILPAKVPFYSLLKYRVLASLSQWYSWIRKPDIYEVRGLHDSGYRLMDFVVVLEGEPICRLSGCSDVLHLDGIGGFGYDWLYRYGTVPSLVPPSGWCIDCLQKSGLLRLFNRNKLWASMALSSFKVYSTPEEVPQQEERRIELNEG